MSPWGNLNPISIADLGAIEAAVAKQNAAAVAHI